MRVIYHLFACSASALAGWLFLGLGLFTTGLAASDLDLVSWWYFSGELETAPGTVLASRDTGWYRGSRRGSFKLNPITYIEHTYSFTTRRGQPVHGVSYVYDRHLRNGQAVVVEFPRGKPRISRIQGMTRSLFFGMGGSPPRQPRLASRLRWAFAGGKVFILLFPILIACRLFQEWRRAWRAMRLFGRGRLAFGKCVNREVVRYARAPRDDPYLPSQPREWRLTFEYLADDANTYVLEVTTETPKDLLDESYERIIYDPIRPSRAYLFDDLAPGIRVDANGRLYAIRTWREWAAPVLATLAVSVGILVIAPLVR